MTRRDRFRRFLIWMPVRLAILIVVVVATAELGLPSIAAYAIVFIGFAATVILQLRAPRS